MKKYNRILSLLLVLSILISPFTGMLSDIAMAEGEESSFEFDEETGTITGYKGGNPPADLVIPEKINGVEVKHIGDKAFYYSEWGGTINKQLNSVVLPEGLESIGSMAFQKNNFTEIELPSTLTTLGQRSLAYNKLKTIEFPDGLKSIGKEAFQENEFTEIEIPSHIEEIEEGAFKTNKIEKVVLHDGLKTIGAKAFEDNLIEEIEIPETVVNWPSTDKDNSIFRNNGKGTGTLYLAKVYNNSGATPKNTFGIVNPASVTIEYKDSNGAEIKPSKTIVGKELKIAEKEGTGYRAPIVAVEGSGKDLLNYDAEFGYKLIEVIDDISENYYQMNREYTFEPEEIEGYELPETQTVTLDNRENTITFIYTKEGETEAGPEADLRRAADILEVTIQNTDNKLTSPITDDKWITLVDYDKGGDNSIYISWESSNENLIEIDGNMGYITLPEEGEEKVRLTATLCKGEYKLEKHFDYVLTKNKPEESEDEKYLSNAIKSLEWFKVNLNSDEDKNVNVYMKDVLKDKGFEGIDVSVKSSNKQEYIDLDGNINYIFDEEYLKRGLPYDRQVALTFQFSKGEAKKDFFIRTVVGWDREKVRDAIEKNIIEPMSKDLVGENEGFDKIKQGFEAPTNIEYTTISWESSDNNILKVEPSSAPLSPSNIKVTRASEDKEVDLICKVKFNHDDIELEKKYTLTVLAFGNEDDTKKEMQKLLDENYTVEKLKDFTNKQPIDANDVKNDIQLLTPRNTGIKDYSNYEFKVTSDNDSVVINTYRANVYRPLPGEEAKIVNLTVQMRHKEKDITVSKVIPIKVTALSQKEIDDEIQLMELVKENYFQGIKGDNTKATEITSDLKAFREANLIDGELVWTRHIDDDRNTGIYPDEIEGSENQEQWRLFRSSNPQIIKHENLIVTKPEYTTDVKIESTLSSKLYGKYAERYPDREDFQKLYRQNVSATVTVIGEKSGEDITEPDKKTLEVNTAIIVIDKDGNYEIKSKPQKVTINKDEHDGGLTAFGALQATTSEYEGDGWITSIYGITGPSTGGWMFTVNGKVPNVGAKEVKLKEGDKVIWYCTYNWKRDKAPQWEELIGKEPKEELSIKIISNKKSIKVGEELPLTAEVRKGEQILTDKEIMWLSSNAEIATIDENNKLIAHKVGEVTITAALVEDKNIKDAIKIEVVEKDKEDLTVEEVIKSLRGYYSNKDEFKFRPAIGYNYTSDNLEKDLVEISSKFKINEEPKSASEHVGNIIGLIATGKDPYNYNNKNYVETLVKSQNKEGKFIIGEYDDYSTTVAFSVLALDMANAEYNRDKAINALLGYQKDDGSFGGVDETGMVLTALAKYKDKSKVQTAINKGLKYLKEQQDENTGGFIVWGGENPYSASAVLQGLIAVGEDPLSEKWTKGGKTIVDSLMNFYRDGYFENVSEWGTEIDSITEQAFIALADVYRGKSMFNEIKLNTNKVAKITIDKPEIDKIIEGETIKLNVTAYDKKEQVLPVEEIEWTSSDNKIAEVDKNGNVTTKKSGKVTIIAKVKGTEIKDSIDLEIHEKEFEIEYIGDTEVKNGQQANAKVKMRNLTGETKPATLIVTLYDKKTNKLLNYSIVEKELESKEELELGAGFLVPETGDYYIKAFLWDGLKDQNIIMHDVKEIKMAN